MNAPWTALGTPAVSIPMRVAEGLPLGLQLTGDHGTDALVLRTAVRIDRILNGAGSGRSQPGVRWSTCGRWWLASEIDPETLR